MTGKTQDNTHMIIRAKTAIKAHLIYNYLFTENSETVLREVMYGKPNRIIQTTQSY